MPDLPLISSTSWSKFLSSAPDGSELLEIIHVFSGEQENSKLKYCKRSFFFAFQTWSISVSNLKAEWFILQEKKREGHD